jgi:hypothetical protein
MPPDLSVSKETGRSGNNPETILKPSGGRTALLLEVPAVHLSG